MSDQASTRPLFVVVYPYKVTDFHCELFEMREFEPYCETRILDVSQLVAPAFAAHIDVPQASRSDVCVPRTWRQLRRELRELRRRAESSVVCIQNVVPHSLATGVWCNLLMFLYLRGRVRMFDLYISGTPVTATEAATNPDADASGSPRLQWFMRAMRQTTTVSEAVKKVSGVSFRALARFLPSALTHRLVAGSDWESLARNSSPRAGKLTLVRAHSHDYSHTLLRGDLESARGTHGGEAVLLDAAGPMFGDDYAFTGRKRFVTVEAWYPALCAFFDRLESAFGVRVAIAGHPKSRHPRIAPYFGNRHVHYGATLELVRNARFVMTRQSAAVALAVMFRKPIIFLCSDEVERDLRAIHGIRSLAALFGKVPVNVDHLPADLSPLLDVDLSRYEAFERSCLTSDTRMRPNSRVILEDIMNIPHQAAPRGAALP